MKEGGTDSTSTAQYKPACTRLTMRRKISSFLTSVKFEFSLTRKQRTAGLQRRQTAWGLLYCGDTGMAESTASRI